MSSYNRESLNDLKISGSGSVGGGSYRNVIISGSGKIEGNVECNTFKVSGSGSDVGSVVADSFEISGSGVVTDNVTCKEGSISGSGKILGNVEGGKFTISGSGRIEGNFTGDAYLSEGCSKVGGKISASTIEILGLSTVGGDIEGEAIIVKGGLKTPGMVNGDNVDIQVNAEVEVGEIGASKVRVIKSNSINSFFGMVVNSMFSKRHLGYLKVNTIEADDIYLENTVAKVVRGSRIVIGPGCDIKRVEYKESFEKRDNSSIINEEQKI